MAVSGPLQNRFTSRSRISRDFRKCVSAFVCRAKWVFDFLSFSKIQRWAPKSSQQAPKRPPRRPKMLPRRPMTPQDAPRCLPRRPTRPPRGTQVAPRGPTRPAREAQVAPRGRQEPPKTPHEATSMHLRTPKNPKPSSNKRRRAPTFVDSKKYRDENEKEPKTFQLQTSEAPDVCCVATFLLSLARPEGSETRRWLGSPQASARQQLAKSTLLFHGTLVHAPDGGGGGLRPPGRSRSAAPRLQPGKRFVNQYSSACLRRLPSRGH